MVVSSARMAITGHCTSIVPSLTSRELTHHRQPRKRSLFSLWHSSCRHPSPLHKVPTCPKELRAVKITNVASDVLFSDESIAEAMDYLASIGINAILPVVQNGGYTQFYSEVMDEYFDRPLDPRLNGRDVLEVVLREATQKRH